MIVVVAVDSHYIEMKWNGWGEDPVFALVVVETAYDIQQFNT